MAIDKSKLFTSKQVDNAAADLLYTLAATPSSNKLIGAKLRFTNTTGAGVTIQAWAGSAATVAFEFIGTQTIGANSSLDVVAPVLVASEKIYAQAGAATSITVHDMGGTIFN